MNDPSHMHEDRPVILQPFLWQAILRHIPIMKALQWDAEMGGVEQVWLIRHQLEDNPNPYMWLQATQHRSLGMMMYLGRFHIRCLYLDDMIQFMVDQGYLLDVIFICTYGRHHFQDHTGYSEVTLIAPKLDEAVKKGFRRVVGFVVWHFERERSTLLDRPGEVLEHLCQQGDLVMLRYLVPHVLTILPLSAYLTAVKANHAPVVTWATRWIEEEVLRAKITECMEWVGVNGSIALYDFFQSRQLADSKQLASIAFVHAVQHGHTTLVQHILTAFPRFTPDPTDLLTTCRRGHLDCLQQLRLPRHVFVLPHLKEAISSGNYKLVEYLHQEMKDPKYDGHSLRRAIESQSDAMVLTVFKLGRFYEPKRRALISEKHRALLVNRQLHQALEGLHRLGITVYNGACLVGAARNCDFPLMKRCIEVAEHELTADDYKAAAQNILVSTASPEQRIQAYEFICDILNRQVTPPPHKQRRLEDMYLTPRG